MRVAEGGETIGGAIMLQNSRQRPDLTGVAKWQVEAVGNSSCFGWLVTTDRSTYPRGGLSKKPLLILGCDWVYFRNKNICGHPTADNDEFMLICSHKVWPRTCRDHSVMV